MSAAITLTKRATEELLALARKRFELSCNAESELRINQLDDKKFRAGEHWPEKIKKQREADGRPVLVVDRLTPQIKQVTNQQRQMRPAIQVDAVDNLADPKTAEVLQGMCRHIETQSDADDAYDQAGKDQAEIGRGWFRIRTDYCDDETGNQKILIDRIRNPFSVYDDPAAERRDRNDRKFLFKTSDLLPEDLKARYPKAKLTSADLFEDLGDEAKHWIDGERIRVAEYWIVESTRRPIPLPNGGTRTIETRKVRCYVITALEVLESYEWAGKYIPFVCVLGEEIDIEGRLDIRGMVRGAKDPQRMFDYWKSATTEAMALAPKAPFLVAEGQIEPYLKMWQAANAKNLPYLIYKPTTLGDKLAPAPARQTAEPPIQAMLAETQASENDIRAATGFFDTNQRETREMSGVAIRARQQQGEHGNSDYIDGLARAVRFGGRILVDLIPKIYDAPRVVRILGLDNKPKAVMVHAGADNAPGELPEGVTEVYDLGVGEFDVTVNAGPNYPTARREFVEQVSPLFEKNPQLFGVIGDLFFENMDLPNAKQIAERLKKMLPPELRDENGQIPPEAQAQIAQMAQQLELVGQALQEAQQKLEAKQIETDAKKEITLAEIESKERIAVLKLEADTIKARLDAAGEQARLQNETERHLLSEGREAAAQELEHAHEMRMASAAATSQVGSQAAEHEHASTMQATKPQPKGKK